MLTCISTPYLLLASHIVLYGHFIFCLSIHRLTDSYFYLLDIMNDAAINIHVQAFLWTYPFISVGHIPRSGIAESYKNH